MCGVGGNEASANALTSVFISLLVLTVVDEDERWIAMAMFV